MAGVRGVPGEGGKAGSDLAAVFSKSRNKTLQQNATRSLQALGRLNTFAEGSARWVNITKVDAVTIQHCFTWYQVTLQGLLERDHLKTMIRVVLPPVVSLHDAK